MGKSANIILLKILSMEMFGVFSLCYISGMAYTMSSVTSDFSGPFFAYMLSYSIQILIGQATSRIVLFLIKKLLGSHFNPAVTIAMITTKNIPAKLGLYYIIAQILGSFLGGFIVWTLGPNSAQSGYSYALTFPITPKPNLEIYEMSDDGLVYEGKTKIYIKACLAEFQATFLLVFVVYATTLEKRGLLAGNGIAIGGVILISGMTINSVSGAALNPCRWIGPVFFGLIGPNGSDHLMDFGVYIFSTIIGGVVGGLTYKGCFLAKTVVNQNEIQIN